MSTIDQQFVEYIVKSLVEYPDEVIVDRIVDEKGVLLSLTVNPEDLGRVIGRRGITAQSLRTMLRALGTKNNARYNLKIVNNDVRDEEDGESDNDNSVATSTSDDSSDESVDTTTDEAVDNDEPEESSYAKKSREELAELDDLDI